MKTRYFLILFLVLFTTLTHSQTDNRAQSPDRVLLPYNRIIHPAGMQIIFGDKDLENHALDAAISSDGKWLAVEERYSIVFISTETHKIQSILPIKTDPDLEGGMNTYSGIVWHIENGVRFVYWSCTGKGMRSFVASASWDGEKAYIGKKLEYKAVKGARLALPNEILFRRESGKDFIYVVLNGNNQLVKQDLATGEVKWTAVPGVAPYGIAEAGGKIYVTNWAGRFPEKDDKDVAGVPWGLARVDNEKAGGATREGSVAVIDPVNGKILREVMVGLHPNEITSDRRGRFVYVTNSNSDNVSVINTKQDEISETISLRLQPGLNNFFGDSPNGLCVNGRNLYVANGLDNAIAVINLGKKASVGLCRKETTVKGFIPTGAYPSAVSILNSGYLYICNLEAQGVRLGLTDPNTSNPVYNAHHMLASISVVPVPGKRSLKAYTDTVVAVNNLARAASSMEKPRESAKPVPVPERIGEPSVFSHVLYIIKENRTYDQVLGDMKQGNGDPGLCIFGRDITPNTHKLAEEFSLLDNFLVSGKCSAEGHQWTDASIVTDYIEKNMRAWFRSYPHVQEDALVYAPTGFIWDNALKSGKTVKIYGEASSPEMDESLKWQDVYQKYRNGEKVEFSNVTTIEPVRSILSDTYPSFGNHKFSDQMRADALITDLKKYETMDGDSLPELMVIALPNDHTNGTRPGFPKPESFVADNDYALGRIVEAFSKSRFWKNTVIFVVEDDSQSGWDHVSAYRTVSLVISPYSRLNSVNHTYYTQPSMVRTIEQILGMPPMNVQDAIANIMSECFKAEPDLRPYTAIPNKIPFDDLNPPLSSLTGKALYFAKKSMLPEFEKVDSGNDDLLNRILWFSAKGNAPYPVAYAGSGNESENDD